ncbi:hypothetical protein EON65_11450 [archaeon]|nr:MAG: hypothetical protein EON65_11450 [archaeon]
MRDLPDASNRLIEMQTYIVNNEYGTSQIILRFLELVRKPLIELKSNERLTVTGKHEIENYFNAIFQLLPVCSAKYVTYIVHTLHCVIHAGQDPTALKVHKSQNQSEEDGLSRIVDVDYLMARIYCSGGLTYLATASNAIANALVYTEQNTDYSESPRSNKSDVKPMTREEELAFYGVPVNTQGSNNNNPDPASLGSPKPDPNADSFSTGSAVNDGDNPYVAVSPYEEENIVMMREVTQAILDFALDLSVSNDCTSTLCEVGMCHGVLVLLRKDFEHDSKDRRIPSLLELLWSLLESFMEQVKIEKTHGNSRKYYLMKHEIILDLALAIDTLKNYLLYLLNDGYKLYDKECRNEVIIVLTLVADFPRSVGHFLSSNMMDILVTYACVEEVGHSSWPFFLKVVANARNFATASDVDLDFKKSVWNLIGILLRTNDTDALLCFAASPFMSALLSYLEHNAPLGETAGGAGMSPTQQGTMQKNSYLESKTLQSASFQPWDDNNLSKSLTLEGGGIGTGAVGGGGSRFKPKTSTWQMSTKASTMDTLGSKKGLIATLTPNKLRELQVQAIFFLVHHAPKVLGEFERLDGPRRVLNLALKHSKSENAEQKTVVLHSLLLLYRCLVNSITLRAVLEDSQVIQSLLFLFMHSVEEDARAQALRILSSLCSSNNVFCQSEVLRHQGLQLMLLPLREYITKRPPIVGLKAGLKITVADVSDPISDPLDNPFAGEISVLVISVLDCLMESVVGNIKNELSFADIEGLDALLDLLEISPFILRLQVMRLLSDLLLNPRLVVFVNVWRSSKTLRSAAQLLCHAWMDEEARLQSERKEQGVICDLFHPLQSQAWPLEEAEKNIILLQRSVAGNKDTFNQSVTVNKLATAILAGRNAIQTNLPLDTCHKALECDQRVVTSNLLETLGLFDLYDIQSADNPFKEPYATSPSQSPAKSPTTGLSLQNAGAMNTDTMLSPKERQVSDITYTFHFIRQVCNCSSDLHRYLLWPGSSSPCEKVSGGSKFRPTSAM